MAEKSGNPYDLDGTTFQSERYLEKLLKVKILFGNDQFPRRSESQ